MLPAKRQIQAMRITEHETEQMVIDRVRHKSQRTIAKMRQDAKKMGASELSLHEINEEIAAVRHHSFSERLPTPPCKLSRAAPT
jgi:hypothetical protein